MPKIKFQPVKFKTLDEFFDYLPEHELKVVKFLRQIVLECLPEATEKLSYNVPYYSRHKMICFIWPSAVKWGKDLSWTGVRFGFSNGNLLTNETNYFDLAHRKQVSWREFETIKDVNVDLLKSYIFEAAIIDQELNKSKTSTKKKKNGTTKRNVQQKIL